MFYKWGKTQTINLILAANTLSGVQHGAEQVEVTINGIGDRAGNAALEEVVMAIKTRPERFNVQCGIDAKRLTEMSNLVSEYSGAVLFLDVSL